MHWWWLDQIWLCRTYGDSATNYWLIMDVSFAALQEIFHAKDTVELSGQHHCCFFLTTFYHWRTPQCAPFALSSQNKTPIYTSYDHIITLGKQNTVHSIQFSCLFCCVCNVQNRISFPTFHEHLVISDHFHACKVAIAQQQQKKKERYQDN